MQYEIVYYYQNQYDATADNEGSITISADSEESAINQFRDDYGDEYHILCVIDAGNPF